MTRALFAVGLFLFACTAKPSEAVDPVWGKQACDHCMMLLSEPRPAAQLVQKDGTRRFFDDVGCMAAWIAENDRAPAAAWIRSPSGSGWQDAFKARFARGQRTPMDYGFLPAATGLSFAELQKEVQAQARARAVQP